MLTELSKMLQVSPPCLFPGCQYHVIAGSHGVFKFNSEQRLFRRRSTTGLCPRCHKAIDNEILLIEECEELDYLRNKETKYCYNSVLNCSAHTKDFINISNLIISALTC